MNKTLKKAMALWVSLVVIDQAVKLLIVGQLFATRVTVIPGILRFSPVQNRNLNWFASMADYSMSTIQMVFIQLAAAVISVLIYKYFIFLSGERQPYLNHFLVFLESGIFCSFLDVIFWGGSLDFIALMHWFVFDLKDVYLSVSVVFLLLCCLNYLQKYNRLDKVEQRRLKKQRGFFQWIKSLRHTEK